MPDNETKGTNPQKDPDDLTKAEASKKIDELQQKTGRGLSGND